MTALTDASAGEVINNIYADYIKKATDAERATSSNERVLFLNESYRKKQYEYNLLFFYVFIAILFFFILVALKRFVPFIPTIVINLLIILVFFIVSVYVVYKFYDIQRRYVLNFDEIDTNTDIQFSDGSTEDKKDMLAKYDNYGYDLYGCKSDACCPENTIYDKFYRKCIPDVSDNYFGSNSGAKTDLTPTLPTSINSIPNIKSSRDYKNNNVQYYYIPSISDYKGNTTIADLSSTYSVYTSHSLSYPTNPIIYVTTAAGCVGGNLVICGKTCVHKDKCPPR
jgi:hypothetical protein